MAGPMFLRNLYSLHKYKYYLRFSKLGMFSSVRIVTVCLFARAVVRGHLFCKTSKVLHLVEDVLKRMAAAYSKCGHIKEV